MQAQSQCGAGDYLGIGAGAHGKITTTHRQEIIRLTKVRHPQRYMHSASTAERVSSSKVLSAEDAAIEYVMNALRLRQGFTQSEFTMATGLPFTSIETAALRAIGPDCLNKPASSSGQARTVNAS